MALCPKFAAAGIVRIAVEPSEIVTAPPAVDVGTIVTDSR